MAITFICDWLNSINKKIIGLEIICLSENNIGDKGV